MATGFNNILRRLGQRELALPYLDAAVMADNWPMKYLIEVDSSPYYGLDDDGRPDGYFHPSTHSLMPERQLYYMFHPATRGEMQFEQRTLQSHMTLAMGSALHAVVQTKFQMTGLLRPENIEWQYTNHDHWVRGRIDFILDHPAVGPLVCELKTQNAYQWHRQDEIKPEWDAQLSLALDNYGADFGILMSLEAGFPYRMREYRVPRNDALLSQIYGKFDRVREAIALDRPPQHCCAINSKEMKDCPARFSCWLAPQKAK